MSKLYKCKGTHKLSYGYGCLNMISNENNNRVYGIGKSCGCWFKWLKTDKGQTYINKSFIPKTKKKLSLNNFNYKKEKAKVSTSKYRADILQPLFNRVSKLIDYGQPCIVSGRVVSDFDAGHYHSVGKNETISLNLHNIFLQSRNSNRSKGGEPKEYADGLRKFFGNEYYEFINSLQRHKPIKLTIEEMKFKAKLARKIINYLKANEYVRSPKERIQLRNEFNKTFEIYDANHCIFELKTK